MNPKRFHLWLASALCLVVLATTSCVGNGGQAAPTAQSKATLQLTSSAFAADSPIPAKYTCDGQDISPPLTWGAVPPAAKSLALIADDPDGGDWIHWVIFNIPATATGLDEGLPKTETVVGGTMQGKNDFSRLGYGGPCPPSGNPHHYFFRLYALDSQLELAPGASRQNLIAAMQGHILAQTQLVGTYQRK